MVRPTQLPRTEWEPLVDTTKRKCGAVVSDCVEVVCSTLKPVSRKTFPSFDLVLSKIHTWKTVGVEVTHAVSSKILEGNTSQ